MRSRNASLLQKTTLTKGSRLQVPAPAKINLALHVTGQRADGYHLLDSLVTFTELGDRLSIDVSDDLDLTISGSQSGDLSPDTGNLVLRAANLLRDHVSRPELGAAIHLEKVLPVASGIGGGSADAAATLIGLNEFWGLNLSQPALQGMSLPLGADIPMCIAGTSARVQGIGEHIEPVGLESLALVLLNPGVAVSTPDTFQALQQKTNAPLGDPGSLAGASPRDIAHYLSRQRNDLQAAAMEAAPAIGECLDVLERQHNCLFARMSGSGATCFGLFDSLEDAETAAEDIQRAFPQWWVAATKTIG